MIVTSYWPCVLPILRTRWFIYWWLVNILFFSICSCPCSHIWWWNINKCFIKKSTSHLYLFALLFYDEITESFSNKQIRQNHLISFLQVWWRNIKKYFKQTKSSLPLFSLFDDEISKSILDKQNRQITFSSLLPCLTKKYQKVSLTIKINRSSLPLCFLVW